MCKLILVAFLLSLAGVSQARVWRVEKNGSGDFTVIQQAVDASASGDTIQIGPGRYDDKFLYGTPPWQQYTRVLVTRADLTLIGAGAEQTIIGDAVPLGANDDQDNGVVVHEALGGSVVSISNIGFENCYFGLYLYDLANASIDHCRFDGNDESIRSRALGSLTISNCEFESLAVTKPSARHVLAHGPGDVVISDSHFTISSLHAFAWVHLYLLGVSRADVQGCTMTGGNSAIYATDGEGILEVVRCSITDQFNAGIIHTMPFGTVRVADTRMALQYKALLAAEVHTIWEVDRLVIEDAVEYSFGYLDLGGGHIRDSHLAKGQRYVVRDNGISERGQTVTLDMTNNWWGTANADSIQAWIHDGNDQPSRPYYFIDWEPCRSVPVGSERRSLGGVRALFR